MKKLLFLFLAAIALTSAQENVATMYMIGDSTMANKDTTKGPERGWGMMVQQFFNEEVLHIENHAVNGRSSKSFIDEGRWQVVLDKLKPGDFVVIQFGHNDEKAQPERHTDPGTTFDANLKRFVQETFAKGATPILMSPCVRRNFYPKAPQNDDDEALRNTTSAGTEQYTGDPTKAAKAAGLEEGDTLYDTHGLYRYSAREVALETNCPYVDANFLTHRLEQGLGRERSKKIHMWYAENEVPEIPQGRQDNTHYNIVGARAIAYALVDAMCKEIPQLNRYRNLPQGGFGGRPGMGMPGQGFRPGMSAPGMGFPSMGSPDGQNFGRPDGGQGRGRRHRNN